MTGINATTSPSSLAFSIKKAFDEFPRLKIIFDTKKIIKGVFLKLFFCLSPWALFFIKGVSLTNFIKNRAITAGTIENKKTIRILLSKKYKISSARSGPPTAPILSIALWNPKALPFFEGSTDVDISASLDGVLAALPVLSINFTNRTAIQVFAKNKNGFEKAEIPYPKRMNNFLFYCLSDNLPKTVLNREAVLSAMPSIIPIIAFLVPMLTKNSGISG